MFREIGLRFLILSTVLIILAMPRIGNADDYSAEETYQIEQPEGPSQDQPQIRRPSKLSVHGSFSVAYATSDGHQVLGIPEDGTADYRNLAVQIRYEPSRRNTIALQLNNEKMGQSPTNGFRDDVEIDWAFYERHLTNVSSVKIGRIPVPLGIFNEMRDVTPLLPFYRPPSGFYGDAGSVSQIVEAVDGAAFYHSFAVNKPWNVDAAAYAGVWDPVFSGNGFVEARSKDTVGISLWLNTPVAGLRLGIGGLSYGIEDGVEIGLVDRIDGWWLSVDADFDRYGVQSEVLEVNWAGGYYRSHYVQAGVRFGSRYGLFGQAQFADLQVTLPFIGAREVDVLESYGLALRVNVYQRWVIRAEVHRSQGFNTEIPTPNILGAPLQTTFGILSLGVSF